MKIFFTKSLANISITKVVITTVISLYMFYYMAHISDWHFVDNINLIFHEAGHIVFGLFGEFIRVLGGTIMQILVPIIFSFYFYKRQEYFSFSLLLFWVSQSLMNVYVYARDATLMELPLLGGDSVYHDWNYILSSLGLINKTDQISLMIYATAVVILIFAIVLSFKFSITKKLPINDYI